MKLSKSETVLIQILIVLVVFAVGFFLFISPMLSLIQVHKLSILTGQEQIQQMNMVIEQASETEPLIEVVKKEATEKAKSIYPLLANVEVDDELMNLAYQTNTSLSMLLMEDYTVEDASTTGIAGVVKQATITLTGQVEDLYKFVDAVNNYSKSLVIASVTVDDNNNEKKAEIVLYFMQADMSAIQ